MSAVPETDKSPSTFSSDEESTQTVSSSGDSAVATNAAAAAAGTTTASFTPPVATPASSRTTIAHGGAHAVTPVLSTEEGEAKDGIVVPSEITPEMKQILVHELKFRPEEVSVMRPDIAAVVVEKRLARPLEGMPENWFLAGKRREFVQADLQKRIRRIVIPLSAVALALTMTRVGRSGSSPLIDWDPSVALSKLKRMLLGKKDTSFYEQERTSLPNEDEIIPANEHVNAIDEPHPHSIRPEEEPPNEEELDVSWLDKIWTKMSRMFRAFARAEI